MGTNIKNALTRKWGPLPAWAWFVIFGGAYYYYRKYRTVSSGTGTGSVAPAAATPQAQQILQPGESVYDPNTGTLTTAPGSGAGSDAAALTTAMDNLANAIGTGMPAADIHVITSPSTPPAKQQAPRRPALTAKGAMYAPFGHNRPAAKAGFTIRGLGRGFWEYVPKPKGQTTAKNKTSKHTTASHKSRGRSTASKRVTTGGRTTARAKATSPVSHRSTSAPVGQQPSRARQVTRTPAVTTNVTQRRVATTPKPKPKASAAPNHRPSAPPARTVRSPAKKPVPRTSTARKR